MEYDILEELNKLYLLYEEIKRVCMPYMLSRMIIKTNSRCHLIKLIRLGVYRLVIFTLYYYPAPPPWKVVANSIYPPICIIFATRKGVYI